jgi:hypothetical protein
MSADYSWSDQLCQSDAPHDGEPQHRDAGSQPPTLDARGRDDIDVDAVDVTQALPSDDSVPHPVRGSYLTAGNPVKLSAPPTKIESAPLLGQHNQDVLTSLGYGEAEIAALKAAGAI